MILYLRRLGGFFRERRKALSCAGLLLAAVLLLAYSLSRPERVNRLYVEGTYYFISTLLLLWIFAFLRALSDEGFDPKDFLRRYYPGLIAAALMAACVELSMGPGFKVLSDETDLLSVSQSMFLSRKAEIFTMAERPYGSLHPIASSAAIDVRPCLFPYLTSLLHTVLGYRPANPFILNFILLTLFFAGAYVCAAASIDARAGFSAVFLLAATPLLTTCATSAGYDLLAALLIALAFAALARYLARPSGKALSFLCLTLLLGAYARHESGIYLVVVACLLALFKCVGRSQIEESAYSLSSAPLLVLPLVWLRVLAKDRMENPPGVPLFSLDHFARHAWIFLKAQWTARGAGFDLAQATWPQLAGAAVLASLLVDAATAKRIVDTPRRRHFLAICAAAVAAQLAIVLSHFLGDYTAATQTRLFLVWALACALAPLALYGLLPPKRRFDSRALLALSVGVFFFYHPRAVEGQAVSSVALPHETRFEYDFLRKKNDHQDLVIAFHSAQFVAADYACLNFGTANKNKQAVLAKLAGHMYHDIVVFQRIAYGALAPLPDDVLDKDYALETVGESYISPDYFVRISEVKAPR
jgi:hypothetical protein